MNSMDIKDLKSSISANPNITVAEYLDLLNKRQKEEKEKYAPMMDVDSEEFNKVD